MSRDSKHEKGFFDLEVGEVLMTTLVINYKELSLTNLDR